MSINTNDEVFETCAWCKVEIPEDDEVFGLSGSVKDTSDLKTLDGDKVTLELNSETANGFAPPFYSDAKREGRDVIFMLCSEKCAGELEEALNKHAQDDFESIQKI